MSRRSALVRLGGVVVLVGTGLAAAVFAVIAAGAELAYAALGMSPAPDVGGPVVVGLVGGECLIGAFVVGLRARTTGEER
jgi:hypothetical protein